ATCLDEQYSLWLFDGRGGDEVLSTGRPTSSDFPEVDVASRTTTASLRSSAIGKTKNGKLAVV
ncbi:MAG: hypothetical protein LQ344_006742, partial [Seirophora lacunosa]